MAVKVDRLTRVNEIIKREIANEIERSLTSFAGMLISVTQVDTSVDLRNATVYISIFGGDHTARHKVMNELGQHRHHFQQKLAKELAFKHTPVLNFQLDNSIAEGDRVFELLESIEKNNQL